MAALTYNNSIPTASQRLKDSQSELKTNTESVKTFLETNHEAFSSTDSGKHKYLQLTQQGSSPTIGATEAGLYTKDVSGSPELFIKTGADTELNITSLTSGSNEYTCYLPSGLILKWGLTTGGALAANDWTTVNFVTAFPTACLNVQVSGKVVDAAPSTNQTTALMILDSTFNASYFKVFNRRTDAGTGYVADCTYFAVGN